MQALQQALRRVLRSILVAAITVFCVPAFAEDAQPSGTIVIDQTQVELILGGDLGKGHLSTGGVNYTFKTGGLKLGGVGIHTEHLIGHAYHMTSAADFEGIYFEAEAGITVAKGKGGNWMKNSKGVTIHLRSADDSGVALSVGVEGLKIHDLEAQ
jgi:hypothetical protein